MSPSRISERITVCQTRVVSNGTNSVSYSYLANSPLVRQIAFQHGTTLTMDMLKADLVIKHGQDVTLIASAGGIEVRAAGRALSDAAGGTRVKVQNLSSLKVVEGVVEGPDLVRVAQ